MTKSTREGEGDRDRDRDRQRDRETETERQRQTIFLKMKRRGVGGWGENRVIKTHIGVFTNHPSCSERH